MGHDNARLRVTWKADILNDRMMKDFEETDAKRYIYICALKSTLTNACGSCKIYLLYYDEITRETK